LYKTNDKEYKISGTNLSRKIFYGYFGEKIMFLQLTSAQENLKRVTKFINLQLSCAALLTIAAAFKNSVPVGNL